MCGIAGILFKKDTAREKLENLKQALAASLHHRGPDDVGFYQDEHFLLVHTRLSIIDVKGGHEPFVTSDYVLGGNGEIYNSPELRADLTQYPYQTGSDIETVLPLYQKYGTDFADHLRGMYALALYDKQKHNLTLSRDPYGIKPLYYVETSDYFAFASEIQSLIKSGLVKPELNQTAFTEVLQLRYNTGTDTSIADVYRVAPGQTLVVSMDKRIVVHQIDYLREGHKIDKSFDRALENLEKTLNDSVSVHLRSDVPYGLFLSGGLDSATILHYMARLSDQPVRTYTVGFDSDRFADERGTAKAMAESVGAHHTEIHFTGADFWTYLPKVIKCMDDPIADQAMLPTCKLAERAHQDVKVVLCGEGGDEMLAGYRRYGKVGWPRLLGGRRIAKERGVFDAHASLFKIDLSDWHKGMQDLLSSETIRPRSKRQIAQAIDIKSWLANNLLTKLDRCLMAHGVEGRTPLLDPEITKVTFFLPEAFRYKGKYGKWILRKFLERNFPIAEPFSKKKGFRVPVADWMQARREELAVFIGKQTFVQKYCHVEKVEAFFRTFTDKDEFQAWSLLTIALWYKYHICGEEIEGIL